MLSPLIHQCMKTFEKWIKNLLNEMNCLHKEGPPPSFSEFDSKNFDTDSIKNFNQLKILKYNSLLDPKKTPFMYYQINL